MGLGSGEAAAGSVLFEEGPPVAVERRPQGPGDRGQRHRLPNRVLLRVVYSFITVSG